MNEVEIDLIQGALRPGDSLSGVVRTQGPGDSLVHLTFQGEEMLAASQLTSQVLPFFEVTHSLDCSTGTAEFHIPLPGELPPSYHSHDLRCQYTLKGRRKGAVAGLLPGFRRDAIHRIHIPVLAPHREPEQTQHWFVLAAGGVELEVRLDSLQVEPGQSLTGELQLRQVKEGPMPQSLTFRFAAIEESKFPNYKHRKVMGLQTNDITPEPDLAYPFQGLFEFPIDRDAPASGEWHSFRVHYGFRVGLTLQDGQSFRESMPIEVCRFPL